MTPLGWGSPRRPEMVHLAMPASPMCGAWPKGGPSTRSLGRSMGLISLSSRSIRNCNASAISRSRSPVACW